MNPLHRIFFLHSVVLTIGLAWLAAPKAFAAKVGEAAPDFSVIDSQGKIEKLSDFKGKYVVLEWHNPECPYVKKHYVDGNMQKLQKDWQGRGVAWLTVLSSAQGKEGFYDAKAINAEMAKRSATPTAVLLDAKGEMGRRYGAKTTPHMFIVNPEGKLVYNGAIDDKPDTEAASLKGAQNYVSLALEESMSGKPVSRSSTAPYGCSVKY